MLRPARPLNTRLTIVSSGAVRASASAQAGCKLRLRRAQQRGADLRGAGAEQQGGGDAARIANAAGRHDRDLDGVDNGGNERKQPDHLPLRLGRVETAAMAAGFHPLHRDDIGAGFFGGTRLGDGRHVREPSNAGAS